MLFALLYGHRVEALAVVDIALVRSAEPRLRQEFPQDLSDRLAIAEHYRGMLFAPRMDFTLHASFERCGSNLRDLYS